MTRTFYIKEGDTAPTLTATLKEPNGEAVNLSGTSVFIRVSKPRGGETLYEKSATIEDAENGEISYTFEMDETSTEGRYRMDFRVNYTNERDETYPNNEYHTLMVGRGFNDA